MIPSFMYGVLLGELWEVSPQFRRWVRKCTASISAFCFAVTLELEAMEMERGLTNVPTD